MYGLDYLLSPFSPNEFIENYWGKRAVYIPNESDKFEHFFGWEAVNDLLFSSRNFNGVRLIHDKRPLDHKEFNRLDHWLQKGATLAINNVNQIDPVVSKFQSVLSHELNTHVNINTYMSYPTKQGFDNHADRHDVFIVHTEGEKDWVVFPPTNTFPLHKQRNQNSGEPPNAEPYLKCKMKPGDVMYIPRGHWHYAQSITPSVHLTVGPASSSASEFMLWWAHELMDNEEFYRKDFPLIRSEFLGGEHSREKYDAHFNEFQQRIRAMIDDKEAMSEYLTRYFQLHNQMPNEFNLPFAWDEANSLSPETKLSIRDDQKFMVYYNDDTVSANIIARGKEFSVVGISRELLAELLSCQGEKAMRTAQLFMDQDNELEWEKLKGWLMDLYQGGLMRFTHS